MIPALITLTALIGLKAIASNQAYIADLEQQVAGLEQPDCKDGKSPLPGCGRRE